MEKAIVELEERLATALTDLEAMRDSNEKLTDELAARSSELDVLRRQTSVDCGFRRHVELVRELEEARGLNEHLLMKLSGRGRGVVMLSADGRLRRDVTASCGQLAVAGPPSDHHLTVVSRLS